MVFQHSITGCGCKGISAGWGRWEGCAVKQGAAALFSLQWTVTAAFMVTVKWGRAPSHTPLCFVLQHWELSFLVFICKWKQEESSPRLTPTSSAWDRQPYTFCLKRPVKDNLFCFPLLWACEWSRAWQVMKVHVWDTGSWAAGSYREACQEKSAVENGRNARNWESWSCTSPASAGQGSMGWGLLVFLPCGLILPSPWGQLGVGDLCPALEASSISWCRGLWCSTDRPFQATPGELPLDFTNAYQGFTGCVGE